MKKLSILIFVLISFGSMAQLGQVHNGDFEDWNNELFQIRLDDYLTTQNENPMGQNIVRSTDAQSGSYSVRMQTTLEMGDTITGYVVYGSGFGDNGPIPAPYTSQVGGITGYYKYHVMSGDTAYMMMWKFQGGSIVGMDFWPIVGSDTTQWNSFTYSSTTPNQAMDSIVIGFTSSTIDGEAIPGSWLAVDNYSLTHPSTTPAAIPNSNFENWTEVYSEDADGWWSFNGFIQQWGQESVRKSTDAHGGTYAAEVETTEFIDSNSGDTIFVPGIITNGQFDFYNDEFIGGDAIYVRPDSVEFYYKYMASSMNSSDQGSFQVIMWTNAGDTIGEAVTGIMPSASYQKISIPITYMNAQTPDSVIIVGFAGEYGGSTLIIDDVAFTGGNVSVSEVNSVGSISLYPQPATDFIRIQQQDMLAEITSVEVFDMVGKRIDLPRSGMVGKQLQLDVRSLPAGTYLLSLNGGLIKEKLIIR